MTYISKNPEVNKEAWSFYSDLQTQLNQFDQDSAQVGKSDPNDPDSTNPSLSDQNS